MMGNDIERILNFIRDHAKQLAKAKADRVYLEQFRKSKKAILIRQAPEGTIQSKESYAYAHKEYLEVLDGLKIAVEEEEKLRFQMKAAELKFEAWRTEQANNRLERKGYGA